MPRDLADELVRITDELAQAVDRLRFAPPVAFVYNPLTYAAALHHAYLRRYGNGEGRVLLVGMNPGPFGMAQTGIPFGDVACVRDFLKLDGEVNRPDSEHPKRPVLGMACLRGEVSGTRLWGWAAEDYGSAKAFFARFFVVNYCPLVFMEDSGRNLTPDKLPAAEQKALFSVCDQALRAIAGALRPSHIIGVGAFARDRAESALAEMSIPVGTILHPSPASPAANAGWAAKARAQLSAILGR